MANISERVNVGIGVIVERDGKYLLGRRLAKKHGYYEYSFPGGKPDPGESPEVAAARELYEETGLTASSMIPLGLWTYDRWPEHEVHCVTLYFMADVCSVQEPQNMEPEKCAGWYWYESDFLPQPLFAGIEQVMRLIA